MIDFNEHVQINDIKESEYNPRVITPEALVSLQESLQRFGMIKPLIVNNANNVIVAGHQRRKAALSIGMTDLPCVWIRAPNAQDEIHFNMLHNSIETSQNTVRVEDFKVGSYHYCPSAKIRVENEPQNLLICSEITRLLSQYGEWGSVVTDGNGVVLLNAEYAYCAKKMGYGVLVYAIPNDDVEEFLRYINIEYGKYNFDNIPIKTYHQFKAQLCRRSTDGRRLNVSNLYEKYLIPNLQKTDHIIDVGAGRMAYMKYVKSMGYDIHAYEPSLMTRGANHLDMKGIIANILDAEKAVICNACTAADGSFLTCTRNIEFITNRFKRKELLAGNDRALYCLDEKNYAMSISMGIAFKQKFHTQDSYVALLEQFYDDVQVIACTPNAIYCICKRPKQLSRKHHEEYLEKELNIEYPGGFKHNKHKGFMDALIAKVAMRYG